MSHFFAFEKFLIDTQEFCGIPCASSIHVYTVPFSNQASWSVCKNVSHFFKANTPSIVSSCFLNRIGKGQSVLKAFRLAPESSHHSWPENNDQSLPHRPVRGTWHGPALLLRRWWVSPAPAARVPLEPLRALCSVSTQQVWNDQQNASWCPQDKGYRGEASCGGLDLEHAPRIPCAQKGALEGDWVTVELSARLIHGGAHRWVCC